MLSSDTGRNPRYAQDTTAGRSSKAPGQVSLALRVIALIARVTLASRKRGSYRSFLAQRGNVVGAVAEFGEQGIRVFTQQRRRGLWPGSDTLDMDRTAENP